MSQLQALKAKALQNPDVKQAYDELNDEFELINTLLSMRTEAKLTQQQVADRMGTKESNISRLEKGKSNPTLSTLVNYAKACGFQLDFSYRRNS
ncbi:helix-turn-helix transcriptional regulator [Xenorhabdus nematophila]|uniref:HTH cro/C1-type domain-containing protein n=1 Tax=Xenorhabdus nematophila (strain ATCC 19061 / DSM 3370 / CCUG 14189 / LMG 1036 / NCIMB 9965 / AN6) TaxID=406817 RepID=D3VDA8_XENNA|nr:MULTISPECIES: helix-turn-helix transcriptional regulator [Xenorhabdus]CEE91431.1 HipB-like protein (HipAB toxin-antitoxin system) [Xenorhabdus nematophila str. Anatoliense]CEF28960.1 HipB-like protein (HipAB toxin-antitoxin system) [Xenorhabdus nematophila str. Websteri]AYA42056.1 XRE family transcriptional regulator [Xenorhabdus nematophila]KHD27371.1 XRE family transcriptional regulator [Xenorhabdus nematophila]MBA0020776.1 helix-turn-helix transcriptional regulator [Xenorhabdus nematophi